VFPYTCRRETADGRVCQYVAPSRSAYSRHLVSHHGLRLRSRRTPYSVDYVEEMTPGEASRRQRRLSSRQGGRQRQRAALRRVIDAERTAEAATSTSSSLFRVISVSATRGRGLHPEGYHTSTPSSDASGGTTNGPYRSWVVFACETAYLYCFKQVFYPGRIGELLLL